MKKAPTISLELNPSSTNKEKESFEQDFYEKLNSYTSIQLRKFLKKLSPYSLTTIERLFNYKPTKECDIESFQLKLANLLFSTSSSYELVEYTAKNNIDIDHSDYNSGDFLYSFHHDRNAFEKHLFTNVKKINDFTDYEQHNMIEAIYLAKQTRIVPPVFFLSDELLFLFLNTDLPEDISFLGDYYENITFFLSIPRLDSIKYSVGQNGCRFYRSDNSCQEYKIKSISNNLIMYANLTNGILKIESYLSLVDEQGAPPITSIKININDIPHNKIFLEEITHNDYVSQSVFRFHQLCINLILYSINKPIFNTYLTKTGTKPKIKAKDLASSFKLLNPRYISLPSFTPSSSHNTSSSPQSSQPSRSISPHFRRGHWKRVAIGKNRLDRDIRWIKPTYVNTK